MIGRKQILMLSLLFLSATGCGKMALNLDNVLPSIGDVFKMSNGAEFVAASQKGEKTTGKYTVDTSTGASYGNLVATTPNGYKIYSTVQGQMTSETLQAKDAKTKIH